MTPYKIISEVGQPYYSCYKAHDDENSTGVILLVHYYVLRGEFVVGGPDNLLLHRQVERDLKNGQDPYAVLAEMCGILRKDMSKHIAKLP